MPPPGPPSGIAELLLQARAGDQTALERLLPLVYGDLRSIAEARLRALGPGQTIQPTELVHEAYMRLTKTEEQSWESKRHFIAVAALAMRSIIVDRARARYAKKRGDGRARVDLHDDLPVFHDHSLDVLEVDEALRRLEAVDARSARVVALRFYLGLSEPEIAQALGVTDRTVRRDWTFAKLWLQRALAAKHGHPSDPVHPLSKGNDG